MATTHSRQPSFASSFVSTNANTTYNTSTTQSKKRTPVKIGPWRLGKTLGKGATSRVFLATNVNTKQKAAVKIVSKAALANDSTISEEYDDPDCDSAGLSYGIEREIIIMKLLNHNNVLRLYDVWETEKALYLVLEYVEGGELFDLLVDSGPLPEKTAVDFFRQIILGAAYCHNLGICHRDLKPENILLDKDLNVKIADFGMAALESGRLLETSCGSPHYAAPEIVSGLQYHGAESDVWSCGVILFALLTGRLPFDDDNIRDLLLKVQRGEFEIYEALSDEAVDLIHQMLTVAPEQRIKTNDILKHPLIQKYYDYTEDEEFKNLPSVDSGLSPVKSRKDIDQRILENLVILWHGRSSESIVKSLLSHDQNPEKTFYCLLMRYRHEHSQSNNSLSSSGKPDELVRSTSIISKTTEEPLSHSSPSSSNKSRRISYTAGNAINKSISFNSVQRLRAKSRDSLNNINNSSPEKSILKQRRESTPTSLLLNNTYSPSKHQSRVSLQSTSNKHSSKRQSMMTTDNISSNDSNNSSDGTSKRLSLIAVENSPTKNRSSIAPPDVSNLNRMLSNVVNSKSNSKLKRNSVTSKVLSSYAQMNAWEKNKKSVDDYGKRASSDFAALCDVLFGDDSKKDTSIINSDSMATINAIVFGSKGNKRSSFKAPKHKRYSKIKPATSSRIKSVVRENNINVSKTRNSSNPVEKITQLLDQVEINDKERRTASEIHTVKPNSDEPPKPVSRLDPRYRAYETYKKRSSQHAEYLLRLSQQIEAEEKAAAEIKAREEKLKKEQEELERLKKYVHNHSNPELMEDFEEDLNGLSSGTVLKKPTISNDTKVIPPRKSKLNSNRYSNLSLYSTKNSSKRLSFYLKELDEEIAKNFENNKKDRISRLSMLITEPLIAEDEDKTDELNISHSMDTLREEETTNGTDYEDLNNDGIGKPRSASVSDMIDNELYFTPQDNEIAISQSGKAPPLVQHDEHNSTVYDQLPPPLVTKSHQANEDSFLEDSEAEALNIPSVPVIPSAENRVGAVKKTKSHETFETIQNALRESKQEFDDDLVNENVHQEQPQKVESIQVPKQRQPLSTKPQNNINEQPMKPQRKGSVFNKLVPVENNKERKSSFSKAIKSLFGGSLSPPESIETTLSVEDSFEAIKTLLVGWKHYGIGRLDIDSQRRTLKGEISKNNTMNVKSCKFVCTSSRSQSGTSRINFIHEKGSSKSFARLVSEVKRILAQESVLA